MPPSPSCTPTCASGQQIHNPCLSNSLSSPPPKGSYLSSHPPPSSSPYFSLFAFLIALLQLESFKQRFPSTALPFSLCSPSGISTRTRTDVVKGGISRCGVLRRRKAAGTVCLYIPSTALPHLRLLLYPLDLFRLHTALAHLFHAAVTLTFIQDSLPIPVVIL